MSEPLHVAFVWHMHQPNYRSALSETFEMPWVRMHALKDYADMVQTLAAYPALRQTFNLVPSLVEQLEAYASGDFVDTYWQRTLKPAAELDEPERAFIVERMCEPSGHRRAASYPRYLELARKRESCTSRGWPECARTFTTAELRDLQVWFNLAWFDPEDLEREPLSGLVARGRDFREEDKKVLADAQAEILARTLPAYREALARGQVELTTSPYFHPILPLLVNTDSARISSADTLLPPARFAHPEDAREQIQSALEKHVRVFGELPKGMWCSEQAVGEDVLPLLMDAGLEWTISDETVLARSLSGAAELDVPTRGKGPAARSGLAADRGSPYIPYLLQREGRLLSIVFRDHTLSDLIGFGYQSWDAKDAAADLLRRLHDIQASGPAGDGARAGSRARGRLVTIALDGENAWEYYPRDGRDFLAYLYEGLSGDDLLRCVTVSDHLSESPATEELLWLHTGSWIGGDLRTWSGDSGHHKAWNLLHQARDRAAAARAAQHPNSAAVWRHILAAEGSDWFWWFGDHHRTELDHVWDQSFRLHLQMVYRALGQPVPAVLRSPILGPGPSAWPSEPAGPVAPVIDGVVDPEEWQAAGHLTLELPSTMQPADATRIDHVLFGWQESTLCLLVAPGDPSSLAGLEVEVRVTGLSGPDQRLAVLILDQAGHVEIVDAREAILTGQPAAAWKDVLEVALPLDPNAVPVSGVLGLLVGVGRRGITEHVFRSEGTTSG